MGNCDTLTHRRSGLVCPVLRFSNLYQVRISAGMPGDD